GGGGGVGGLVVVLEGLEEVEGAVEIGLNRLRRRREVQLPDFGDFFGAHRGLSAFAAVDLAAPEATRLRLRLTSSTGRAFSTSSRVSQARRAAGTPPRTRSGEHPA